MSERLRAALFSALLHLVLLLLLGVSLTQKIEHSALPMPVTEQEAVPAVAVDEQKVMAEIERIRNERESTRRSEQQRKQSMEEAARRAENKRRQEEQRAADLKRKAETDKREAAEAAARESERLAKLRAEQVAEQKRLSTLKAEQEKVAKEKAAEQQRLAKLKAEQERVAKEKAAEQQRLTELENRRKAEEERVRREKEEKARQERERALQQQLAVEAQRLAAEQSRELDRLRGQYEALIHDKVKRNWTPPPGTSADFKCELEVKQIPGGTVIGVQITSSSGNQAIDHSVENAVQKASPLPSPPDPRVFDREIKFVFSPSR